ncbi:MAG: helix-turn-helix domain-containing protein [Patescibacteria group bacterium]|nr:helix-turn-helix domain-containing protein [Patescibacteria group bacterium]
MDMPPQSYEQPALTGTLQDVAEFFRVSPRTVKRWISEGQERLGCWKRGGSLVFGEDDVVSWWCAYHRNGHALQPGQGEALARELWRRHMRARAGDLEWRQNVERRIETLAAELGKFVGDGRAPA